MMFNRSKAQAIALLVAVFLVGGAAGWGVAASRGDHWPQRRGPDAMVDFLSRKLSLSAAQRDSVREGLKKSRHQTRIPQVSSQLGKIYFIYSEGRSYRRRRPSLRISPAEAR